MLELGHRQCFKTVELQSYEQSSSLKFFIFLKNKRNQCPEFGGSIADLISPISDHQEPVKGVKTDGQCHHPIELTESSQLPSSNVIFCKLIAETKKNILFETGSHVD